ncbi:MAG: GNAT family N-acetyltransferase [Pseudomonadota bacterium]
MPAPIDILITPRLTLRPPLEVDAEPLAMGLGDFDVASRLSRVPHPYSLQDAVDWIASKQKETGPCDFTVHREKLIGAVSVHQRYDQPTLGYWFAKPAWGKGYATEAARAVMARAFRLFDCEEIRSYTWADNAASLRVMEKLGFEQTGTGKTHCTALGEEIDDIRTSVTRGKFERLFGSLDTKQAA